MLGRGEVEEVALDTELGLGGIRGSVGNGFGEGMVGGRRRSAVLGSLDPSESPYMAAGLRMDSRRTIIGWILWIEMQKCRQILIDERKDSGRIFFYFVGLKCIFSSSQCPTWHVSDQMD